MYQPVLRNGALKVTATKLPTWCEYIYIDKLDYYLAMRLRQMYGCLSFAYNLDSWYIRVTFCSWKSRFTCLTGLSQRHQVIVLIYKCITNGRNNIHNRPHLDWSLLVQLRWYVQRESCSRVEESSKTLYKPTRIKKEYKIAERSTTKCKNKFCTHNHKRMQVIILIQVN